MLLASGLTRGVEYRERNKHCLSQRREKRKGQDVAPTVLPSQRQAGEAAQRDGLTNEGDIAASPSQIIATVIHKLRTL